MATEELIVGLVSISDRASQGVYKDEGIPALEEWFGKAVASPAVRMVKRLIPDERPLIEKTLKELVGLKDDQLAAIDLPESLRDAVLDARRIKTFEARRRQMQYIGKIMRKVDAAPIRSALDAFRTGPRRATSRRKPRSLSPTR